ncbi:hypothetical protein EMCRGX_G027012 [Ephydatia muelleri]
MLRNIPACTADPALTLASDKTDEFSGDVMNFSQLVVPVDNITPILTAWMSVTPSESFGLHLDPPVFQVAIKWWLGLDTSEGSQSGVLAKAAAQVTEARKHQANDPKCPELGLATFTGKPNSVVLNDIYGRLNVHRARANATAILSRDSSTSIEQNILFLVHVMCVYLSSLILVLT